MGDWNNERNIMDLELNCKFLCIIRAFILTLLISIMVTSPLWADYSQSPALEPPFISSLESITKFTIIRKTAAAPNMEWTFHKTADGEHPDDNEQQLLWLMNRARSNPVREGIWLAETNESDIKEARTFFKVDLDTLKGEFASIQPKAPAAFDVRLYNAAKSHSDDLIARDTQDHEGQFTRVSDAGFNIGAASGNVFSYARSALHGHAGFNIDWGINDSTGMQDGRGHRQAIMATSGNYTNTGLAMVSEADSNTNVGPFVITGNYASANEYAPDHYNRFLVGTVWQDQNSNGMYDPGEGIGNITVTPDQGSYYAVTSTSGGYTIPAIEGTYSVTFSGPALADDNIQMVTLGSQSLLLDYVYTGELLVIPEAVTLPPQAITRTSTDLIGSITTNSTQCSYYFEYGETTGYGNSTSIYQTSSDTQVAITVSDLTADTTFHCRLVLTYSSGTIYGQDQTFVTLPGTEETQDTEDGGEGGGGGGSGCFIGMLTD